MEYVMLFCFIVDIPIFLIGFYLLIRFITRELGKF